MSKPQKTRIDSNADRYYDAGNTILRLFDADTKRQLANDSQNAWNSLNDNLACQSTVRGRYETFYKLTMTVQLAGAAILPLKMKATTVTDEFDVEYKSVIDIPEKESEL